ncbi:MAG: hypothetical protein V4719_20140 [Planctomycetota bacterium]
MTEASYIIRWYRRNDSGVAWTIRGINHNGAFYGEWLNYKDPRGGTIVGQLGECDNNHLQKLLASLQSLIDATATPNDTYSPDFIGPLAGPFAGAIARGKYSNPDILLRYKIGDEAISPAFALFVEIAQFLDPIMDAYIS